MLPFMSMRNVRLILCSFGIGFTCYLLLELFREKTFSKNHTKRTSDQKDTVPKHVVFVMADDLGYGDVGFNAIGSGSAVKTPFLDSLAKKSVQLNSYYTMPTCSPTRGALMTGIYPSRMGTQTDIMMFTYRPGLPLEHILMPEYLKKCAFATHMVGKWHLGHCKTSYLPHKRGFDTFFGYISSIYQYFGKPLVKQECCALDLMYNGQPVTVPNGTCESEMVASRAGDIIADHDPTTPLFLYLPFQTVHLPLVEAPEKYSKQYQSIRSKAGEDRYKLLTMINALDHAVETIVTSLKDAGMWDDTLFVFTSDNGGFGTASNWPLRGGKGSLYEGGMKVPTLVHYRSLDHYVNNKMMHVTDWLPTILSAVECDQEPRDIDGINQWNSIKHQTSPPARDSMLHMVTDRKPRMDKQTINQYKSELEIFYIGDRGAIREGSFKLITGVKKIKGHVTGWTTPREGSLFPREGQDVKPVELYNIAEDPNEENEISQHHPKVVKKLLRAMAEHQKKLVHLNSFYDISGCPSTDCSGYMVPWLD